jgi:vacuolar protein-sorting-associated protein 4
VDTGLESIILAERPNIRFADVASLEAAKHLLDEAIIMSLRIPEL